MSRADKFVMRVSEGEREAIKVLAERLQRTQADAVRLVVREAVQKIAAEPAVQADVAIGPADGHAS